MPFKYFNLKLKKLKGALVVPLPRRNLHLLLNFLHLSFYSGVNSYNNFRLISHSI